MPDDKEHPHGVVAGLLTIEMTAWCYTCTFHQKEDGPRSNAWTHLRWTGWKMLRGHWICPRCIEADTPTEADPPTLTSTHDLPW
jgi:hypothetical protein